MCIDANCNPREYGDTPDEWRTHIAATGMMLSILTLYVDCKPHESSQQESKPDILMWLVFKISHPRVDRMKRDERKHPDSSKPNSKVTG